MARNKFSGICYLCGLTVSPGTGHFERHAGRWRTKHANYPGDGRITCIKAAGASSAKDAPPTDDLHKEPS